jgi:rhodanese-related sulfurtransferase
VVVSNIANLDNLNKIEGSYILLDLRAKDQIEKDHIPNAVAAPDGKVEPLKGQFPTYMNATIILYNQDGDFAGAKDAYKTITGWGYKQVSVLDAGFAGWQKSGNKIATGPAASAIKYVRKLLPGEMDVQEFSALVKKPAEGFVVIDVRSTSEMTDGKLPNTINIPLEELESRLAEIPKDKTLVLHCSTGNRAEMAYNVLEKAGFKPKYVKGLIEFDKEDKSKYTIKE